MGADDVFRFEVPLFILTAASSVSVFDFPAGLLLFESICIGAVEVSAFLELKMGFTPQSSALLELAFEFSVPSMKAAWEDEVAFSLCFVPEICPFSTLILRAIFEADFSWLADIMLCRKVGATCLFCFAPGVCPLEESARDFSVAVSGTGDGFPTGGFPEELVITFSVDSRTEGDRLPGCWCVFLYSAALFSNDELPLKCLCIFGTKTLL
mmetsp:Transcript_23578/g.41845  ORF Transcript_23578/g.41845 Transcript_23578/m.41845 type:complete len:210 (+) Transcript_23578:433-1062(+)